MALIETHPSWTSHTPGHPASPVPDRRDARPEACDASLRLEVVTEDDADAWDRAERFVYDVYRVSGFCDESPRQWVEEAEPYRAGSRFHVLVHEDDGQIVGVIRTFVGPYDQLPIGQFPATEPVPSGTLVEIGSLAVRSSLRGLGVANELHRSAVQDAIKMGVPAFCMLVEPWAIDFFRSAYGLPLTQTAPARDYMGSLTVPAIADIGVTLRTLASELPGVYEWVTEGLGAELWRRGDLPIVLR